MNTDWPTSLGGNNDRWIVRWRDRLTGADRGQVFGGPKGLWTAINSARSALRQECTTIASRDGVVIYDLEAGIDVLPDCTQCGRVCDDPSTHMPAASLVTVPTA